RKLRAVLSALGISIGIATMVAVTAIPASSQAALDRRLTALGTDMLRVDPLPQNDIPTNLPIASVGMVARNGPVTRAAAVANTHVVVRRTSMVDPNVTSGLTVLATTLDLLAAVNGSVAVGRFLDTTSSAFAEVVLGSVAAHRLGIDTVAVGTTRPTVDIDGTAFIVIGILAATPLSADLERAVFVGWPVAQTTLGFDGRPTVVYVKAREDALGDVRSVLPATLHPQAPGLVQVSRPSDALAAKNAARSTYSALFIALAAVSLIVGGVGIANTMLISVLERRREIGMRRALGATRHHIRAQFLTEAILLSAFGGLAGTGVGIAGTIGYATLHDWPTVIPITTIAGGIAGAMVVGIVAGLSPSSHAARLAPVEALSSL
ncbi:MAG: transporter permease, partial [Ilumatobacteraceae bacterium]|nr:transporter permease [Ilumatobacteraceae bacterium]